MIFVELVFINLYFGCCMSSLCVKFHQSICMPSVVLSEPPKGVNFRKNLPVLSDLARRCALSNLDAKIVLDARTVVSDFSKAVPVFEDFMNLLPKASDYRLVGNRELQKQIIEQKAVSTFAFDKVEKIGEPMPNHTLQGYHYQKNGNIEADVVYICKDDCRMAQFSIVEAHTEPLYRNDLLQMTEYFKKKKPPPLAPLLNFDETFGRFTKNLYVEYSPYLSHYGFDNPDAFREHVSFVDTWNRVLNRFVGIELGKTTPSGKPITVTPKNIDIKNNIVKAGFDFKSLIECKIRIGDEELEEAE